MAEAVKGLACFPLPGVRIYSGKKIETNVLIIDQNVLICNNGLQPASLTMHHHVPQADKDELNRGLGQLKPAVFCAWPATC